MSLPWEDFQQDDIEWLSNKYNVPQSTTDFAPYDQSSGDAITSIKAAKPYARAATIGAGTGLGTVATGFTPAAIFGAPLGGSIAAEGFDALFGAPEPQQPFPHESDPVKPTLPGAMLQGAKNTWTARNPVIENYLTYPKQIADAVVPLASAGDTEGLKELGGEFIHAMGSPFGFYGDEEQRRSFQMDLPGSLEIIGGLGLGAAALTPPVTAGLKNLGERGAVTVNNPFHSKAQQVVEGAPDKFSSTPDVKLADTPPKIIKHPKTGVVIKKVPGKVGKEVPGKSATALMEEYLQANQVKPDEIKDLGLMEWARHKEARHQQLTENRPKFEKDLSDVELSIKAVEEYIHKLDTEGDFNNIGGNLADRKTDMLEALDELKRDRDIIKEDIGHNTTDKPFALTKDEIADYIKNEGWEIKDFQYGGKVEVTPIPKEALPEVYRGEWDRYDDFHKRGNDYFGRDLEHNDYVNLRTGEVLLMEDVLVGDYMNPTDPRPLPKFSQYVEEGNKSNNIELFVTANKPKKDRFFQNDKGEWQFLMPNGKPVNGRWDTKAQAEKEFRDLFPHEANNVLVEFGLDANVSDKMSTGPTWRDGHGAYDEVQNPIVRLRMNDRTIDGKNYLFIEEMQGPTGSKEWQISVDGREPPTGSGMSNREAAESKLKYLEAQNAKEVAQGKPKKELKLVQKWTGEQGKMPDSLRSRIYDIGTKRALAYAKENGYDGIAWTTGEMQTKRWENALRQQVDELSYDQKTNTLIGMKNGNEVYRDTHKPEDLGGVVGKNSANKLLSNETKSGDWRQMGAGVVDFDSGVGVQTGRGGDWPGETNGWVIVDRDEMRLSEEVFPTQEAAQKAAEQQFLGTNRIKGDNITIDKKWPGELYGNFRERADVPVDNWEKHPDSRKKQWTPKGGDYKLRIEEDTGKFYLVKNGEDLGEFNTLVEAATFAESQLDIPKSVTDNVAVAEFDTGAMIPSKMKKLGGEDVESVAINSHAKYTPPSDGEFDGFMGGNLGRFWKTRIKAKLDTTYGPNNWSPDEAMGLVTDIVESGTGHTFFYGPTSGGYPLGESPGSGYNSLKKLKEEYIQTYGKPVTPVTAFQLEDILDTSMPTRVRNQFTQELNGNFGGGWGGNEGWSPPQARFLAEEIIAERYDPQWSGDKLTSVRAKKYLQEFIDTYDKQTKPFEGTPVPGTKVTANTPDSFPLYDVMGAVTEFFKGEIKQNGKAMTAAKYGIPAELLRRYIMADDEEKAELLNGPLSAVMVGPLSLFGKRAEKGELLGQFSELGDKKTRIPMSDWDAQLNIGKGYRGYNLKEMSKWEYASFKNGGTFSLGTVLDHPRLFTEYPGLRNVRIKVNNNMNALGKFSSSNNMISLGAIKKDKKGNIIFANSDKPVMETLLHETQHYIQQVEDFARGGTPENYTKYLSPSESRDLKKAVKDGDTETIELYRKSAHDIYEDLLGEEEARRVGRNYTIQDMEPGRPFTGTDRKNPDRLRIYMGDSDDIITNTGEKLRELGAKYEITPADINKAGDAAETKWKAYYDAQEGGSPKETLTALWDEAQAAEAATADLRSQLRKQEMPAAISAKEQKLAAIEQKIANNAPVDWIRDWEADTRVNSVAEARAEIDWMKERLRELGAKYNPQQ